LYSPSSKAGGLIDKKESGINVKARNELFRLNSLFLAICGTLLVAPVMAQTSTQSSSQGVSALPTIPVEASPEGVAEGSFKADRAASTKYVAPLLDTPKTVSVITQELIRETNATSLQEVLRSTPGITFGMGEGGNPEGDRPFIRGFDSQSNVLIDGVRDPSSQSRDMFNVERVDVVKGADSVYNGGGAVGGSINLVQKAPLLENSIGGSLGLGTDKYKRATVDLNRQLGETSAFRLNLLGAKGDVPGRDNVDYEHLGIAPTLSFGIGTPTRVTVGYYHYETDDMPDYGIPYNNPYTAGTANARFNGDGGPLAVNRNNFYGLTGRDFRKTQVDSGNLRVEHDINDRFTISNTTRYTESKNDYIASNPGDSSGLNITNGPIVVGTAPATVNVPAGFLNRNAKSRNSQSEGFINSTQLRGTVDTGGLKHSLAVGFEYSKDKVDNRSYVVGNAPVANILNPNPNDIYTGTVTRNTAGTRTQAETKSAYIFDSLELNRQWSINAGLRYDSYDTHASPYSTVGAALASTAFLRSKNDYLNYQAGVVYKPAANGSVYVNYATASNQPGISVGDGADSLALTNQDLDAERVKSLELGTKWDVLDRRLSLTRCDLPHRKDQRQGVHQRHDGGQRRRAARERHRAWLRRQCVACLEDLWRLCVPGRQAGQRRPGQCRIQRQSVPEHCRKQRQPVDQLQAAAPADLGWRLVLRGQGIRQSGEHQIRAFVCASGCVRRVRDQQERQFAIERAEPDRQDLLRPRVFDPHGVGRAGTPGDPDGQLQVLMTTAVPD
jgi:catecholate siderophore receptor